MSEKVTTTTGKQSPAEAGCKSDPVTRCVGFAMDLDFHLTLCDLPLHNAVGEVLLKKSCIQCVTTCHLVIGVKTFEGAN